MFFGSPQLQLCSIAGSSKATLIDFELTGSAKTGVVPSLEFVYGELKDFAAKNNLYLHMTGMTKKIVGMSTSAEYPCGILAFQSNLWPFPLYR